MQSLSPDPVVAERQMNAIIFYLTTFGHIDGDFDVSERTFVKNYIETLVERHVRKASQILTPPKKEELVRQYTGYFHQVFEGIDRQVKELFTEAVSRDEDQDQFVHSKLKLRCFEIFQSFEKANQEQLLDIIDELIMADGEAHPAELKFRAELAALLEADLHVELIEEQPAPPVLVAGPAVRPCDGAAHPFFDQFEHHYSRDPDTIKRQMAADLDVVRRATEALRQAAARGAGKLRGKRRVSELFGQEAFLDGNILVCPTHPERRYDLTVLGDLHGCYSNLKAAVVQARFLEKVAAFKSNPDRELEPKLVLLGDYIDRGMFSMNGVLRAALLLYLNAPEHVCVLRGNHEYFVEFNGNIYGGVKPSEAIDTLKPHVSQEVFRDYMALFEALPSMLLFERTLFVHGGIPRDRSLKQHFVDLSSLNEPALRFEMLWSDPSQADVIPAELQEGSARFSFGRLQAQRFLQRLGCHTLIRGHEKIKEGFQKTYDGDILLCTLFSAGGADNSDLPSNSAYREVTPMALSLRHEPGATTLTPWAIDYARFNDPERNAFFRKPPELRFGG